MIWSVIAECAALHAQPRLRENGKVQRFETLHDGNSVQCAGSLELLVEEEAAVAARDGHDIDAPLAEWKV